VSPSLRGAVALAAVFAAPDAWAKATLTISVTDDPGVGFNDPTPAAPVAGNPGKTVGEQRLKVFQAAADAWGRVLESSVPIVIDASFAPLECTDGMAILGEAAPLSISNRSDLPTTNVYPLALANKIVGRDLAPSSPDIMAMFNGDLSCLGVDWYYGLDGNAGAKQVHLFTTVMHELAHGLGFASQIDPVTGAFLMGRATVFSTHMLGQSAGKHLAEMTNAERKAALVDVRKLVWDGTRTDAVAARFLAKGTPRLELSTSLSGFTGVIGEANFGRFLADLSPITAEVAAATVSSDCASVSGSFSGKIALVVAPVTCASLSATSRVQKAGGLALLFAYTRAGTPPPIALEFRNSDIARFNVTIPTVAMTLDDADLIRNASGATATLSADKNRLVGADEAGHAFLYASSPIEPGSTGVHWDYLVRPNLIMEPADLANPVTYLDMERAVLWDIGWSGNCGDGTVDSGEACDDGVANSDYFPNACRLDCTKPKCGDGVVDTGEACDPGGNGSLVDSSCDTSCHLKPGGTDGGSGSDGRSGNGGDSGAAGDAAGSRGGGGSSGTGGAAGGAGGGGQGGKGAGAAGGGGGTAVGGSSGSGGSSGTDGRGGDAGGTSGTGQGGTGSGCSCRLGRSDLGPRVSTIFAGCALALWLRRRRSLARPR
jgi:uncharacterized membrane protein YgcG